MAFCTPCLRPADSSVLTCGKYPSISIKNIFRRQIWKKPSTIIKSQPTIERPNKKQESNHRFQRIKGYNFIREGPPKKQRTILSNNYDMTVYYYDQFDETHIALSDRRSKKIPGWARKSQLQLAIIDQIYFEKKPEDIFGSIQLDLAHEIIDSIELQNTKIPAVLSYSNLPPNFV